MSTIEAEADIHGQSSARDKAGTVVGALPDGVYVVACGGAKMRCRRAFSCLVEPRIGDRVVVSGADSRCVYVTAILERPNAHGVHLRVDGDLVLDATRDVCLKSGDALRVASREQVSIETQRLTMSAQQASLSSDETTLTSAALDGRLGKVRLIGRLLETVMDHVAQSCRSSFRSVETVEHLRASHIDHAATESMRLHAKHTLLTAEKLSKIDAAQIHLG
ncbi:MULTISPECIES: DUF3540 domain-containing protein [Burkholderia]|uniref:DUF3540 domain-containing protein n=1 Tax=Burkholderia TaxID=32008 RepID=UPI000327F086|nr:MULTISPECIES: DUF3540 domain-containing protein [Burkholderia]AGK50115.1 hypothetical protein BTI_4616 [Burkholderia thailandensis MSMB121]ATF33874.1 DUF3540 domain-containing protein [Burkholderia thailandensis]KST71959.1 type VI secretion protein [Burkholderia humptydooensis]KVN06701.1 type VI secretion protein [Burkholderia sp. MSMB1552]KWZ50076.1 type VI secretion protein [Burkholderia sp. MSMB1588]